MRDQFCHVSIDSTQNWLTTGHILKQLVGTHTIGEDLEVRFSASYLGGGILTQGRWNYWWARRPIAYQPPDPRGTYRGFRFGSYPDYGYYDYYDDYLLGRVIYKPYLTGPYTREHDVAVVDIVPSKAFIVQSDSMFVDVTVENQGFYAETFNVTVYANSINSGDDFNDNSVDLAMWKTLEKNNGTVSENNGRVECSVSVVPPSGIAGYITKSSIDL